MINLDNMNNIEEAYKFTIEIDKAWDAYWHFDGCEGFVGNGCDDCRDCEEASLKSNLYKKARNLEEGFKNIFGINYKEYKENMNDYLTKDMGYYDLNINKNFFDAQTAKQRSIHIQSGALQDELNFIYAEINKSINKGNCECNFTDKNFSKQAEDFLKEKGFTINHFYGDQRDPCNETTISW